MKNKIFAIGMLVAFGWLAGLSLAFLLGSETKILITLGFIISLLFGLLAGWAGIVG